MNICVLSHRYPYKDNMVHVFVKKLVDEWAKLGHRCVVVSPLSITHLMLGKEKYAPAYERQKVSNGFFVEIYRPRYFAIPRVVIRGVNICSFMEQRCIEDTIRETGVKFDVIYCHFYAMAILGWNYARLNNIPLFVATGESSYSKFGNPSRSFSIEKLRDTLAGVVAVSSKNMNEAISLGYAKASCTEVFPNAADLQLYEKKDKEMCRKKMGLSKEAFIIICVGQFIERKGQRRILAALDILKNDNIKTVFIGKGDDVLEHNSIVFKGIVQNSLIPEYLNAADIFVLPTLKEGCCNAIIEALACGLPVISSDRTFNYDVLNSKNSILVDPCDVNAIANAIKVLYDNKKKRESMALQSYSTGRKLSIEERAQNILYFINKKMNI